MKQTPRNSRLPMLLSAVVFPGAGQFYQRRWIAGVMYMLMFGIAVVTLFYNVLQPLFHNFAVILDWSSNNMNEDLQPVSWISVLIPFAAGLLVYIVNLADVARAERKRSRPYPLLT